MAATFVLAALSCAFGLAGMFRLVWGRTEQRLQGRIWLLVAALFAIVTIWLQSQS